MKKIYLSIILFISISQSCFSLNITWTGSTSNSWNDSSNFSPMQVPTGNDTVTIDTTANHPVLSRNATVYKLIMLGDTLDLNGYELKIGNEGEFRSGVIRNGTLVCNGLLASFSGTEIDAQVNATCSGIQLSGSVFHQTAWFEITGSASSTGEGGNVFHDKVTLKNNSDSSDFILANTSGDVFHDSLIVINQSIKAIKLAMSDVSFFYQAVVFKSSHPGTIFFGKGGGESRLDQDGHLVAEYGDFTSGHLILKSIHQQNNEDHRMVLIPTGGYDSHSLLIVEGCRFSGVMDATAPNVLLKKNVFEGDVMFTKSGGNSDLSHGGNVYLAPANFTNTSTTGQFRLGGGDSDYYHENVTFNSDTLSLIAGNKTFSYFYKNVTVNSPKVLLAYAVWLGDVDQQMEGTATQAYLKLHIEKPNGKAVAQTPIAITGHVMFVNGHLETDSTNIITFLAGSGAIDASNKSFVSGPVKKVGDTAFEFPVGKGGHYRPLGISAPDSVTDAFRAEYFDYKQLFCDSLDSTIYYLNNCNFWTLHNLLGVSEVFATLSWRDSFCGLIDSVELVVAAWNSLYWKDLGNSLFQGDFELGSVLSSSRLTSGVLTMAYGNIPMLGGYPIGNDVYFDTFSAVPACQSQSPDWPGKYNNQDYYIPDSNTPVKTILVNFNIFNKTNPIPPYTNFQDIIADKSRLQSIMDMINEEFTNVSAPSDPWPGVSFIPDTKIRFELHEINFFYNDLWESSADWTTLFNAVTASPNQDNANQLNIMFTNGSCCGGAWGYAFLPSLNMNYNNGVVTFGKYIAPTQQDQACARHLVHEIGHVLDLLHVYSGGGQETCSQSANDYLQDVFGPNGGDPAVCHQNSFSGCQPVYSTPVDHLCTNNLMGGKDVGLYTSPMQMGRMHRALSVKNVRKYVKPCPFNSTPEFISNDETWDFDIRLYNSIRIEPGVTLTIRCKVLMPDNGRIIVERGARLIVDGGTITSSCEMWKGIEVWGNRNFSQLPVSGNTHQGYVEMKNGARIEHALTGITVCRIVGSTPTLQYSGGVLNIQNSVFHNCKRAIHYYPYENFAQGSPTSIKQNAGIITDNVFETTYTLNDYSQKFDAYLILDGVRMHIYGNEFNNTAQFGTYWCFPEEKGTGIRTHDATVIVESNEFHNLYYGVEIINSSSIYSSIVRNNDIIECNKGVYVSGSYTAVFNNYISVKKYTPEAQPCINISEPCYGVYIDQTQVYFCQNNTVVGINGVDYSSISHKADYGILINNCGPLANMVYNNSMENFVFGNQNQVVNDGINPDDGLRVNCNDFDNNDYDIFVIGDLDLMIPAQIGLVQGYCSSENFSTARNQFLFNNCPVNDENQFKMLYTTTQNVDYGHLGGDTEPDCYSIQVFKPNCGSGFNKLVDCPDLTQVSSDYLHEEAEELYTLIAGLRILFDGGDTQLLVVEIADPADASELIDTLKSWSPYLSDEALMTLIENRGLYNYQDIVDVLALNSRLTTRVQYHIDHLPEAIADSLNESLSAYQDTVSGSFGDYMALQDYSHRLRLNRHRLVMTYLNDSSYYDNGLDSTFTLIKSFSGKKYKEQLLDGYIRAGEKDSAMSVLDEIQEYDGMVTYTEIMNLVISYMDREDMIYEMMEDSVDMTFLDSLAGDTTQYGFHIARALHTKLLGMKYRERFLFYDEEQEPETRYSHHYHDLIKSEPEYQFKFFPNPTTGNITIEYILENVSNGSLEVCDLTGKQLKTIQLDAFAQQTSFSMSAFKPGMYMVKILGDGKLIKAERLCLLSE